MKDHYTLGLLRRSPIGFASLGAAILSCAALQLVQLLPGPLLAKLLPLTLILGTLEVLGPIATVCLSVFSLVKEKSKIPALLGLLLLPVAYGGYGLRLFSVMGFYLLISLLPLLLIIGLLVWLVRRRKGLSDIKLARHGQAERKPRSRKRFTLGLVGLLTVALLVVWFWKNPARPPETTCLAFSPDGRWLATGVDRTVILWDVVNWREVRKLEGHDDVLGMAFSPDGQWLATVGEKVVHLWQLSSGRELPPVSADTDAAGEVAFSPDGRWLAFTGHKKVVLFETGSWRLTRSITDRAEFPGAIVFSPDGTQLAWSESTTTTLTDLVKTDVRPLTLAGHRFGVTATSYSPDGRWLASASIDNSVKIWDTRTGREVHTLSGHNAEVWDVAFSPEGRLIATASQDGTIRLWEVGGWQQIRSLEGSKGRTTLAFSPDGRWLASAGKVDNKVQIWEPATGKRVRILENR